MEKITREYLDGKVTFAEFERATRSDWKRLAGQLGKRWRAPNWVSQEDLEQELLLGAWLKVWDFQASRKVPAKNYLIYNSMSCAKRKLHKWRGANLHRRSDFSEGVREVPLPGEYGELPDPSCDGRALIDRIQFAESVQRACTNGERKIVVDKARSSDTVDECGEVLFQDLRARRLLRLKNPAQAHALVRRVLDEVSRELANGSAREHG